MHCIEGGSACWVCNRPPDGYIRSDWKKWRKCWTHWVWALPPKNRIKKIIDEGAIKISCNHHYFGFSQFVANDGKVQPKIRNVAVVVSQVQKILVEDWVERSEVVDIQAGACLAQYFGEEKIGHGNLHQEVLVEGFAQHPADEKVVARKVGYQSGHPWIGIQKVVCRQTEEAPIGIETRLEQLGEKFAKYSASIHAGFVQSDSIRQLNPHFPTQIGLCLKWIWKGYLDIS